MSNTVTVCCKLPNGLFIKQGEQSIRINGWNQNVLEGLNYGLTHDVPSDFWEAWSKEHAESKLVKNGFVFAETSAKRAKDKAEDKKEQKSGHEQLPQIKETDKAGLLGKSDA